MIRLTAVFLLSVSVWLCQANVSAQVPPTPAASTAESAAKSNDPLIQRVPLDAIIYLDKEGEPAIRLPGNWPLTVLDDFQDFILRKEQQNAVPSFTLRNVSATGTIAANHVETDVQIELTTTNNQPVRIPLGFKEGILPSESQTDTPPFRYTGSGSAYLSVDPAERQYHAIVIPKAPQPAPSDSSDRPENVSVTPDSTQRHTLSFTIWLPLSTNGVGQEEEGTQRLALSFPAAVHSQFLLEIPMTNLEASVSQGSILTLQENAEKQSTQLKVQGLRTNTEISWGKKQVEIANDRPVFLVENASLDVRLDDRMTVYDAVLPVSSATGNFEQLQIRLPQNCVLDRDMTDRYAAARGYSVSDADEKSEITVKFQQKTTGPVSIRLRGIQQFEEDNPDFERELSGFEVLGAERQTGILSVSGFPAEKKLYWEQVRGIRRIESSTYSAAAPAVPAAASVGDTRFEFTSQPFVLRVRVISQQTRINVKPEYQFRISRGALEMNARLSYTISGSKVDVLHIRLSDAEWNCECLSSLIDEASVELNESGELTIPLRSPTEGTFDIELRAYKTLPIDDEQTYRIVLPMPIPQATWSEPAPVTIRLANDVEAEPIDESYAASSRQRTVGMTRQTRRTMPVRGDFSELQQEPLFYRTEPAGAVFVADLTYHKQQIRSTMQTNVRLLEESNQVTQTMVYDVDYAPVDRLYFLVPESLLTDGTFQVRSSNQTFELRDTVVSDQKDIPAGWKRKMIQLSEPTFEPSLVFEYSTPPFSVPDDVTALRSLSFICPVDVPVSEHRVRFFAPSDYKLVLQDESKNYWEPYRDPRRSSLDTLGIFRTVQTPNKIGLSISVSEKNVSETTIVERAWLQTWLTGNIRMDQATYLVESVRDTLTLQLPPDALLEHRLQVRINHQLVSPNVSPTGVLMLPLLPEQQNRPVEVSIEYRYPFQITSMEVPVVLPAFINDTVVQYEYWLVLLKPDKHIIACSGGWTLEYDWNWNGLFWGRVPSIRKSDIGFETDDEIIDTSSSQYLFSHLQPSRYVTFYIVNRSLIILCSSGFALFIGLILIYVRQARYIGSLFGLGVILVAVLLYQPPLVLLMLQASVFGVFLALGAGYLYRIFRRRSQWISPAFQSFDEHALTYTTLTPPQHTVHEVIMDEGTASKDTPTMVVNNHHNTPLNNITPNNNTPNGQS